MIICYHSTSTKLDMQHLESLALNCSDAQVRQAVCCRFWVSCSKAYASAYFSLSYQSQECSKNEPVTTQNCNETKYFPENHSMSLSAYLGRENDFLSRESYSTPVWPNIADGFRSTVLNPALAWTHWLWHGISEEVQRNQQSQPTPWESKRDHLEVYLRTGISTVDTGWKPGKVH